MKLFNIKSLSMKDFKGVTTQEFYDFGNFVSIEGDNYKGKTTIAEGILFGLYGVDLQGSSRTDALVNNQMKRGKCEVEIVIETGDGEFKISRSATKTKKTVKIDKKEVTQKEVLEIVGDMNMFIVSYLPTHILGYKDKEAREFFMQFVDEIEPGEVLKELGGFVAPLEGLNLTNIEELKKDLRASNKEWERDLDFIDGRIATIDQTLKQDVLPQIDTTVLEKQIKNLDESLYEPTATPNLKDASVLKTEIKQQHEKMMNIKIDEPVYLGESSELEVIQSRLMNLQRPVHPTLHNVDVINWEITQLRKDYEKLNAQYVSVGSTCPTCHQEIKDQAEIDNHRTEINKQLKDVTEKGKDLKAKSEKLTSENNSLMDQYNRQIEIFEIETKRLENEYDKAKEERLSLHSKNQQLRDKYEADLNAARNESRKEYDRLQKQLEELEKENLSLIHTHQTEQNEKRNEIKNQLSALRGQLYESDSKNHAQQLLADNIIKAKADKTKLQDDIRKTNESIENNKATLEALSEYIGEYAKMQAGQLNKYFNKVSIQLFEVTKTTGEMKPKFKLLYDEKTIEVLSLSERIRLGLEVSNFIKTVTDTAYPTFIDNAESITHFDKIPGQLFTATVVPGKELTVESI